MSGPADHAPEPPPQPVKAEIDHQRYEILHRLDDGMEIPMLALAFVWLALLVVEFTWGLNDTLQLLGTVIWIVFGLDLALKLFLAPDKVDYLKRNWLTVVALMVPALRVFRVFRVVRVLRAARAVRGLRLVRVLTSLNRGMKALGATMSRRGFGYVVALTVVVTLVGAAGMLAFEGERLGGSGAWSSYGSAVWWTAMIMTTLGSEYWPQTTAGRMLCFLLALYGFAIFGYLTATLATFFIGRDAENDDAEVAGARSIDQLREEISALREEIRAQAAVPGASPPETHV
ncbi:MAG: potassium channel family protein [Pseudomonadota bacterium]|nr:potassium channel family protein [Pseudomonadota bacterium]